MGQGAFSALVEGTKQQTTCRDSSAEDKRVDEAANGLASASLDPTAWAGSCISSESTLHQLAPFIGKMKSAMARVLIETYTRPGDVVLDPFAGAGTIPLECLCTQRSTVCSDTNPYAVTLTKAKLDFPPTQDEALDRAKLYLSKAEALSPSVNLSLIPYWVKAFFHPRTLQEVIALAGLLRASHEHFLLACLLGILHHQRPGFLSFPASHLVPYLRSKKFPHSEYPELYSYRAVSPRLLNKICRAYRRVPYIDPKLIRICLHKDARLLDFREGSIDAIISSPPYMDALDYGRDNRLRLWFLGVNDYKSCDNTPKSIGEFRDFMGCCLAQIRKALRLDGFCVLVLGELETKGKVTETAHALIHVASREAGGLYLEDVVCDNVPEIRRARRNGRLTKRDHILVFRRCK